jgi:hypothetical protein
MLILPMLGCMVFCGRKSRATKITKKAQRFTKNVCARDCNGNPEVCGLCVMGGVVVESPAPTRRGAPKGIPIAIGTNNNVEIKNEEL